MFPQQRPTNPVCSSIPQNGASEKSFPYQAYHRHEFNAGRVTRRQPCPICEAVKFCEVCSCGAVHCMNVASEREYKYRQGGWLHNEPGHDWRATGTSWSVVDFTQPKPKPNKADAETLHAVYQRLLSLCPLSEAHRAHLTGQTRQLPAEALGEYGTLPEKKKQGELVTQLVKEFGKDVLATVPGFSSEPYLNGSGLLIPVRDPSGKIQAFQIRQTHGETRYIWLSSSEGPSSGTPVHVSRPAVVRDARIYITEGALKANIAASRLGAVVVAIPGVGTWRNALPVLEALGGDVVVLALDKEEESKASLISQINDIEQSLAVELAQVGYAVRFGKWHHSQGKGLDDLLLSGGIPALEAFRFRIGQSDASQQEEETPHREAEAQSRLRYLSSVIQAPGMPPTQKILYLNALIKGRLWPDQEEPPEPRRLPILTIMKGSCVKSYSTARPALEALKKDGLLVYTVAFDKQSTDGRDVAYFSPGRALDYNETPTQPTHLKEARARSAKARALRCAACMSERISPTGFICLECEATFTKAAAEKAGAKYARREFETQQAGTEQEDPAESEIHMSNFDSDINRKKKNIQVPNFDTPPPSGEIHMSKFDRCTTGETQEAEFDTPPSSGEWRSPEGHLYRDGEIVEIVLGIRI